MNIKTLLSKLRALPYLLPAIVPGPGQSINQPSCGSSTTGNANLLDQLCVTNTADHFYSRILTVGYLVISALAVILIIVSGLQYISAGGNEKVTEAARRRIINIVIAIILLTAAYTVINLITGAGSSIASWF